MITKYLKLLTFMSGMVAGLTAAHASGASPAFLFSTLATFNNNTNGNSPAAPPVLGPDGSLYGTTTSGSGTNRLGTIYRITPDGVLINLHTLVNSDGSDAVAPLMFANDGNLYGTATAGGAHNLGTIFRITTNGTFSVVYSFGISINTQSNAVDGSTPFSGLVQGHDGFLYGTTAGGGTSGDGTVFQLSTNGSLFTLVAFDGANGQFPEEATLVEGQTGVFYGTTYQGGNNSNGVVFQVTSSGLMSNLHLFNGPDGSGAYNGLVFGPDNNLYGTTVTGGAHNDGTVYCISPNGTFTNVYSFDGPHGSAPEGGVVFDANGMMYGTTKSGGAKNLGTVFQMTTNGQITLLHSFTNNTDGENPFNGLTIDSSGKLYGTTSNGGTSKGHGTVFSLQPVPSVLILAPTPGQRWSNSVFQVTGTAASDAGVTGVFYSLNDSAWTEASTSNSWTTWNATINPVAGTNTIAVYATDGAGHFSATNTVKLIYVVSGVLTVNIVGEGTVSPNYSNAVLQIGKEYSMKASAKKGSVFQFWNVGADMTNGTTLKFIMASNLVITANFHDTEAPTVKITSPKNNAKLPGFTIDVTGTASDNTAVTAVGVQINNDSWMTADGTNDWSATLPVANGANIIRVYAMDAAGNISKTNDVTFTGLRPPDWAPDSVVDFTLLATSDSGTFITASFEAGTFSQTDAETNNDSGTGTYEYNKSATNAVDLLLAFDAPLNQSNSTPTDIQLSFTNSNAGTYSNTVSADTGIFSIEAASTIVPKSWTGHTITTTNESHSITNVIKVTKKTQLTLAESGVTTTENYVVSNASPISAMFVITDPVSGEVRYYQFTFTSKNAGNYQVNAFANNGTFLSEDSHFGGFTFK